MKKTFTVNISGRVFNIDEDAYNLLQNYFTQLRAVFNANEVDEVVADIESRMAELLSERHSMVNYVITIQDVDEIINTIGRPEDIEDSGREQGQSESQVPPVPEPEKRGKRLYRNMQDKVFGGVVGGLAAYLGWNANITRILLVLIALSTKVFPLIIVYLIAWMIIPPAVQPWQVLRMYGRPVTLGNMGRIVVDEATIEPEKEGFLRTFIKLVSIIAVVFLAFFFGIFGFAAFVIMICLLSAVVAYFCFGSDVISSRISDGMGLYSDIAVATVSSWSIFTLIVSVAVCWGASCFLFKAKPASKGLRYTAVILGIIFFISSVVLTTIFSAMV